MEFITVRAVIDKDGQIVWHVWTGIQMIRAYFNKWVRGDSLLRFPLNPAYMSLMDNRGIVTKGFLRDLSYRDHQAKGFVLEQNLYPEKFVGQVYIALEIVAPAGLEYRVASFATHYAYPQLYMDCKSDSSLSQIWQVESGGGLIITVRGKPWRIYNRSNGLVEVVNPQNGQVVAKETPYGIEGDPLKHWLQRQEELIQALYEVNDQLEHLSGPQIVSRYTQPPAIVGTTRNPPRRFTRTTRSSMT